MTYELRERETLAELLRFAGGFRPTAATQRIQIRRILDPTIRATPGMDRVVIDVPASGAEGVPSFPLQAGDKVRIFPVTDVERNRVTVVGNVWSAGDLGYRPGMRISEALRAVGGVKPDTYLDQVLIARRLADGSRVQLRTRLIDTTGRADSDVVLLENDTITVYSRSDFRPDRFITVSGAVRTSGPVAYREGMTLRDAILMSGGLQEEAYLGSAEIARKTTDRSRGQLADTMRVLLDSTFLFENLAHRNAGSRAGAVQAGSPANDVPLQPYDQILILRQPDWQFEQRVTIGGEVRFPGTYTLMRRDEKLTDLIARAGGLTERANAEGLRFYRRADSLGRIDVDYRAATHDPASRNNFVLVAGDSIDVPTFMPVVKVSGAVSTPSTVAYAPGKDANYYIEQAGGLALNGDRPRLWVTQPSGARELYRKHAFLIPDHVPVPLAGAEVFVPAKPEGKTDYAAVWGAIAQVTAGLVTVLVVALRK
jgi:protein involved in polysaccharide export with SLBB domain